MLTLANFSDFFLVCKLHKLGLYIATYFGHGQCFVWEFLALILIEIAKQKTTSFGNFSWSGNDTILACKLYMPIRIKILILSMSEILSNINVDRYQLVSFVKDILSQIYSHCIWSYTFLFFVEIVETFVFWINNKYCYIYIFLYKRQWLSWRRSGKS